MQISRPHTPPEEVQKTRERLAGKTQLTAALTTGGPPVLTPEHKATAEANLKARAEARRAVGSAVSTSFVPTSSVPPIAPPAAVTSTRKGTKVPP